MTFHIYDNNDCHRSHAICNNTIYCVFGWLKSLMMESQIYQTTNTGLVRSNCKFKKFDLIILVFYDIFIDMRKGNLHEIYL